MARSMAMATLSLKMIDCILSMVDLSLELESPVLNAIYQQADRNPIEYPWSLTASRILRVQWH